MTDNKPRLGVGIVGYAFMGRAHSVAWRTVNRAFDLPLEVDMTAICGRNEQNVKQAAADLGWREYETDWRRLLERDDISLVDVSTPGNLHAEVAIPALEAGKHVLCEKPLASHLHQARDMAAAAKRAEANGVKAMVGFNYRRVPAATFARQLIADGKLGAIRHVRAVYLQDFITDPEFPLVWRMKKEEAGSGALGDIGSHIVDLTQFMTGQRITGVSGLTETFIKQRPIGEFTGGGLRGTSGGQEMGEVTVDDAALFLARLDGGAIATFEATRFAKGRKNELKIEINGEHGSVVFDLERLNELELYLDEDEPTTQGFRRVLVTEAEHPYMSAWWPAGHIIGWEHTFTHEARDLVEAIATDSSVHPTFADGLQVNLVLDAVQRSADASSAWVEVEAV